MGKRRSQRRKGARRSRQDVICLPPPPDLPTTPPRRLEKASSNDDTRAVQLSSQDEPLVTAPPGNRQQRRAAERDAARGKIPEAAAQAPVSTSQERSADKTEPATDALPWETPLPRNRSLARTDMTLTEKLRTWFTALFQRNRQPIAIGTDEASMRQLVGLREDLASLQKSLDRMIGSKPG